MSKFHGNIPYSLVTEYKWWKEGDSNIFEVYKWGEDFYAYRHLIKKGDSFIENEVRSVPKTYYDNLSYPPLKYNY